MCCLVVIPITLGIYYCLRIMAEKQKDEVED